MLSSKIVGVIFYLSLFSIADSFLVDDVRNSVIHEFETAWANLKTLNLDGKSSGQILMDLANIIGNIPNMISIVEKELHTNDYEDALKSLGKILNTSNHWNEKWNEITTLTSPVDVLYGHFKIFPGMPQSFVPGSDILDYDANGLADLILKPLYDKNSPITLQFLLQNAHIATVSHQGKNAFSLLNMHIEEALAHSYWCLWNGKTPERVIYGLYVTLLLMDIKEYSLLNFAWMLRYTMNGSNPKSELENLKETLENRALEKSVLAKTAIDKASSAYWKCDPVKYKQGVNYDEFKELLQGYIENEVRMHHSGSCKQACSDYTFVKGKCSYPDKESCYKHRVCTGTIVECSYIAADANACLAEPPRRFHYIDYKKGPKLGSTPSCPSKTVRRDSYWRLFFHCSNCFCLCDDPRSPTTERHISVLPVTSDVAANKIVTGVRFVMSHGVLHFQIEEGMAEKGGTVTNGTTKWKKIVQANRKDPSQTFQLEYIQRAMDLDDLLVPPGHVITGVKFRKLGRHANLEVQATQINPITGQLIPISSHWISNDNTPERSHSPRRQMQSLKDADLPTRSKYPSIPDSTHDQFVQFEASSRTQDVSQSTVPFIDIQDVRPSPPVWLQGVGVYHKGQNGYAGFIAPRVYTANLGSFFPTVDK